MAVHKLKIEVTVLGEDDELSKLVDDVQSMSLQRLGMELEEGTLIGMSVLTASETVPPEKVEEELLAVGNDGSFFADDLVFKDGETV